MPERKRGRKGEYQYISRSIRNRTDEGLKSKHNMNTKASMMRQVHTNSAEKYLLSIEDIIRKTFLIAVTYPKESITISEYCSLYLTDQCNGIVDYKCNFIETKLK